MLWALTTIIVFGDADPEPLSFYRASPEEILAPLRQESLQDLEKRADALTRQAAAARQAGDEAGHRRLLAEASWLWAEAKEARGDFAAAAKFRQEAATLGYQPPHDAPHPVPEAYLPHITPPLMPAHAPYVTSLWDFFNMAPYPSMRNNSWFSLVNIPAMEQAATLPMSAWAIRVSVDFSSSDWRATREGGASRFNGSLTQENVQFDFGVTPEWQAGFRFTTGELEASSAARLVVFEDGGQQVRRGERGFNVESLVIRSKYHYDFLSFMECGLLAELKLPLDSRHDLLTADTFDVGLSLLASYRDGPFAYHVNVGGVFPLGTAHDIFRANDKLDPFFTYGFAADIMVNDRFVLGLQLEGNTGTFGQISNLDDTPAVLLLYGRVEINPEIYFDFSAGAGFTDLSSDFTGSVGITWAH